MEEDRIEQCHFQQLCILQRTGSVRSTHQAATSEVQLVIHEQKSDFQTNPQIFQNQSNRLSHCFGMCELVSVLCHL